MVASLGGRGLGGARDLGAQGLFARSVCALVYVWCVPSMHYVLSPTLQSYTPARMKKHAFSLGYILLIGLRLNVAKTKCMPFHSSWRIPTSALEVQLNGRTIDRVQRYKFLGVIITDPLSWSDHIDQVCSKASRCLNLLRRLA